MIIPNNTLFLTGCGTKPTYIILPAVLIPGLAAPHTSAVSRHSPSSLHPVSLGQSSGTVSPEHAACPPLWCHPFHCHLCWFLLTTPGLLCNAPWDRSHLFSLSEQGPLLLTAWQHACHVGLYECLPTSTVLYKGKVFAYCWAPNADNQKIIHILLIPRIGTQTMKSN